MILRRTFLRMAAGALAASMLRFELVGRAWQLPAEQVSSVFARIVAPARLNGWVGLPFIDGQGRDLPLREAPIEDVSIDRTYGVAIARAELEVECPKGVAGLVLVGQVVRVDALGVEHVTSETIPRTLCQGDVFRLDARGRV